MKKVQECMTLNDVGVDYFKMGLKELSYRIWTSLYNELQQMSFGPQLMPVLSCNVVTMLRHQKRYEEAVWVCERGLREGYEDGGGRVIPPLILQRAALYLCMGEREQARGVYELAKALFPFHGEQQGIDDLLDKDYLLYCQEA